MVDPMLQAVHTIFNHPVARKLFLKLRYVLALALLVWLAVKADAALLRGLLAPIAVHIAHSH